LAHASSFRLIFRLLASAGMIAAVAAFYSLVATANAITISLTFLLVVLGIAAAWGLTEAILASALAMMAFNYFFLPPVGTLRVSDPHNWVALAAFIITAITASQLSVSARRRAAEAEARRCEVERLYALGQALLLGSSLHSTASDIVSQFVQTFDIPAAAFYSIAENDFFRSNPQAFSISDEKLRAAANGQDLLIDPENGISIVPVRLGDLAIGSLGIVGRTLSPAALNAVAYLVAVGIERVNSLEEANRIEAARQSEALKSALIDALAHDLKTPLTSIKGALTHLLGKAQEAEEQDLLSLANEETDRLHRLVAEVLEMAQIEAGKLQPEFRPENIGEIAFAAVRELESLLKGREVQLQIPADLPLVDVDFDIMLQALKQLVDNALRYSPADAPITITAERCGGDVVIHVADRGIGIEEEEQTRIFDKFFRGRSSRYQVPGTGLGLSIAKGIVEAHGGTISVVCEPGNGSVFNISLPASKEGSVE
jgi:two-component system, OmpR family, sensor histidine kinase KdpD